jgi:AraC-like DNA-binding protein
LVVVADPFTVNYDTSVPNILPYHTHFHYEIYYFHEGQVSYLINDRIYKLAPGDLILMHGMTLHKAMIERNDVYKRTIIHFDPSYVSKHIQPSYTDNLLLPFTELKNIHLSLRGAAREECEALLHKLTELMLLKNQGNAYAYQKSHIVLLELLLLICQLCQQPMQNQHHSTNTTTKEKHTQDIITFIEQHYTDDITLDQLQEHLHLNKFYLSKTFKEVTGTTIFQYLLERRIYAAKLLLVDSQAKITEICLEVGFKHLAHFSRSFKQATGLTAEQYRRQHQLIL